MRLSAVDRKILNRIQKDIPFTEEPFKDLSRELGIKEEIFLERIRQLKERGIIRNFAAHLDHRNMGFKSTLIALKVHLNKVDLLAKKIIKYPEVTHCYLRRGEYNLWLVFISKDKPRIGRFLNWLSGQTGRGKILNLVTKKQFKLKTTLTV